MSESGAEQNIIGAAEVPFSSEKPKVTALMTLPEINVGTESIRYAMHTDNIMTLPAAELRSIKQYPQGMLVGNGKFVHKFSLDF